MRMKRLWLLAGAVALVLPGAAAADDVTGLEKMLCAVSLAMHCTPDGECRSGTPETWDIGRFIEVHLDEAELRSTPESGRGLSTPIDHVEREAGGVSIQGVEDGNAFSVDIDEATGEMTFALATPGHLIGAFGGCTVLERGDRR